MVTVVFSFTKHPKPHGCDRIMPGLDYSIECRQVYRRCLATAVAGALISLSFPSFVTFLTRLPALLVNQWLSICGIWFNWNQNLYHFAISPFRKTKLIWIYQKENEKHDNGLLKHREFDSPVKLEKNARKFRSYLERNGLDNLRFFVCTLLSSLVIEPMLSQTNAQRKPPK